MFSVIGVEGVGFRGTLEELLESRHIDPSAPAHYLTKSRSDTPSGTAGTPAAVPHADAERYRAAAAAYARTLKPNVARDAIRHAYQVMTREVFVLAQTASAEEAWRAFADRRVGQAPVVDAQRRIVGLVAREHLLHVLNEEHGHLRDVLSRTMRDVMMSPVVTADPVADVRRVARVMLEYRQPAVPVLDEAGHLVGIVSQGDILRAIVNDPPLTLWG